MFQVLPRYPWPLGVMPFSKATMMCSSCLTAADEHRAVRGGCLAFVLLRCMSPKMAFETSSDVRRSAAVGGKAGHPISAAIDPKPNFLDLDKEGPAGDVDPKRRRQTTFSP